MQQLVKSREAEANYIQITDNVLRLVTDLNDELKQSAML